MLKDPFDFARAAILSVFLMFAVSALLQDSGVPIGLNQLALVSDTVPTNPCYFNNTLFLNPGPTTNVTVTSGGQQKTLSIPNQYPSSLLQPVYFSVKYGADGRPLCSLTFGNMVNQLFVIGNQRIPFAGSPAIMIDPNGFPLSVPGFLYKIYYEGLFNVGGATAQERINNEDAIIAGIDANKSITISASTFLKGNAPAVYQTVSVSETNCAKLSGAGLKKIIFMRSKDWNSSVSDFLFQATAFRDQLLGTKPYSDSPSSYSFYADLKKQNSNPLDLTSGASVSSCGSGASEYRYIVPAPILTSISDDHEVTLNNIAIGSIATILGSGFSPEGNTIQLIDSNGASIFKMSKVGLTVSESKSWLWPKLYDDNGTYPLSGSYKLRVSANNSVWSNSIPITLLGFKLLTQRF